MKITRLHLLFWRQRKAPVPSWAGEVTKTEPAVSIHSLIPGEHNKVDYSRDDPYTTIRMSRARGIRDGVGLKYVRAGLRIDAGGGYTTSTKKRQARALKLLRRLEG